MTFVLSEKKKKELWEKKRYYREHPDEALEAHTKDIQNSSNKNEDFVEVRNTAE